LPFEWINYHHLLYFWTVARLGSVTKASEELLIAQPTISGQIRQLEESFGSKLFSKSGRNLILTDFGRLVYRYADEIFTVGRELSEVVKGRPAGRPMRLAVGVADVLPKLVVYRILEPVLRMSHRVHMVCHEDRTERLLAELSLQSLDLVLSDVPIAPHVRVKAYNHVLGASPIGIYASTRVAQKFKKDFPQSLDGAPWLLPIESASLRRSLEQWFSKHDIRPDIVAEFQDSALMKVFAQTYGGLFPAPTMIDSELRRIYGVTLIGKLEGVEERIYAISVERRVKHPAVLAIAQSAQELMGAVAAAAASDFSD
jgi:LysR family transcriptional regulator, transcriptional activator of nhaA